MNIKTFSFLFMNKLATGHLLLSDEVARDGTHQVNSGLLVPEIKQIRNFENEL